MSEIALAVATPRASYLLPLDNVIEVKDMLVVGPAPRPSPIQSGIALHRDERLPLYSLDVVLGEAARDERSWDSREWGGFVVARILGHRCVFGVRSIAALVRGPAAAAALDLSELLLPMLPPQDASVPIQRPRAVAKLRYLLVDSAEARCAVPVTAIERVHAACRTVRALGSTGGALLGVGTVDGRVLPVIDLRGLLRRAGARVPAGYVVTASADVGPFVLAVDRIAGLQDISDLALEPAPDGLSPCITAVADYGKTWILSPTLITARCVWGR